MADKNVIWTDEDGRLCFSMSGPSTVEQRVLVQQVGEALGLPGYFDALCGWWRGEDNRPVDVPLLRALVCAYELGKRAPGVAGTQEPQQEKP